MDQPWRISSLRLQNEDGDTMTRLRGHAALIDWVALDKLATERGLLVHFRRARCQHGRTREQTCNDCENGYVTDTSEYANLPYKPLMAVAVSDDGYDVAFLLHRSVETCVRRPT